MATVFTNFLRILEESLTGIRRIVGSCERHSRQAPIVIGAIVVLIGVAAMLAYLPSALDFGVALAAAIGWCVWNERHPAV